QQSVAEGSSTLGDQFEPMLTHVTDWIVAGYTTADDVATDSGTQEANFIAGDVGIYPMGSWFTTTLAASPPDFEVAVMPAPVREAASDVDAATQRVEYLVTAEEAIATQAEMDNFNREGLDVTSDEYSASVQELVEAAPSFVVPGNPTVGDYALPVAGFNPKFT